MHIELGDDRHTGTILKSPQSIMAAEYYNLVAWAQSSMPAGAQSGG